MDMGKGKAGRAPGRLPDQLDKAAVYGGIVCVAAVLVILITNGEYQDRLADNRLLGLIALALMLPGGILYWLSPHRKIGGGTRSVLWLVAGYALLYAAQLFWVNRVYFYTGWDVGVMKYWVVEIVEGGSMAALGAEEGYSIYPNNLLLFYIQCILTKIGKLLSMRDPYLLCVYVSCLCVNVSCFLGNLVVRRFTEAGCIRGLYTVLSTVMILFSPWIIIPYSDTYGMLFVMLGMWGLLCLDKRGLKWTLVAFAAIIGYSVKPTCIFPLFAAYMTYGVRYVLAVKERWRELLALVGSTLCFWCIGLLIPLWIQHTYSFRLDPEMKIPYMHYIMMGLNEETKGNYNHEDYIYSSEQPGLVARKQADKAEAVRRFTALAEGGRLGEFLREKALINFDDGSFAWCGEGGFFSGYIRHDNVLADWFLETMAHPYYLGNEGKYYSLYRTIVQTIWLSILIGIPFAGAGPGKNRSGKACMMIVICGLMAFVMLFEARARYLYLYTPVFVILSVCGWEAFYEKSARAAARLRGRIAGRRGTAAHLH